MHKCETLLEKSPKTKGAGGVAQVVEHLSSKHKDLSSNPVLGGAEGGEKWRGGRGKRRGPHTIGSSTCRFFNVVNCINLVFHGLSVLCYT
jgi:hypothetical protein